MNHFYSTQALYLDHYIYNKGYRSLNHLAKTQVHHICQMFHSFQFLLILFFFHVRIGSLECYQKLQIHLTDSSLLLFLYHLRKAKEYLFFQYLLHRNLCHYFYRQQLPRAFLLRAYFL